ncbi:MAG: hypothetical protein QNK23_00460 [Crocinitomicaceae bacterium]|nr:hypothetical protein [Crocinitomicaceae bacterium]
MRKHFLILSSVLMLLFTGCIEIIDDLSLNDDGSGSFAYVVNLSSSKIKINSILALDTLDGQKVPSVNDISREIHRVMEELKLKEGISEVEYSEDYDNYMFELKFDFASLEDLQKAIKEIVLLESKRKEIPELDHQWLSFSDGVLERSIPQITVYKTKKINQADRDLLKEGTYTSITRFETEIAQFDNPEGVLSKSKKAIMIRTTPYSLTQQPQLIDNVIYLSQPD